MGEGHFYERTFVTGRQSPTDDIPSSRNEKKVYPLLFHKLHKIIPTSFRALCENSSLAAAAEKTRLEFSLERRGLFWPLLDSKRKFCLPRRVREEEVGGSRGFSFSLSLSLLSHERLCLLCFLAERKRRRKEDRVIKSHLVFHFLRSPSCCLPSFLLPPPFSVHYGRGFSHGKRDKRRRRQENKSWGRGKWQCVTQRTIWQKMWGRTYSGEPDYSSR